MTEPDKPDRLPKPRPRQNPHQHTKKPKTPVIDWKWHNQQRREQIKMHPLHLLVHQFTREHTEHIENPDGTNEYVKVHSYLTQLEHAKNANRGTGTTSGGGRVPVSLVAVDLLIEIEKTTNRNQPTDWNTPTPPELHKRIQRWAASTEQDGGMDQMLTHLHDWKTRIQAMYTPTIILDAPCPRCEIKYVSEFDGAETIRHHTLTYNQHRAGCKNCGTVWEGKSQLVLLGQELNGHEPLSSNMVHSTSSVW